MITPVSLNFVNKVNSLRNTLTNTVSNSLQSVPSFKGSGPSEDIFEKSTIEPGAIGYKRGQILDAPGEDFIKWAEKTDFLNGGLKEAFMPENFIGEGFEHAAYRIPSNDRYVLRVPRDFRYQAENTDFSGYTIKDTWDPELTRNCGQQIAVLEVKNQNVEDSRPQIEVLLTQKGYANSNPSPRALKLNEYSDELRPGVLSYDDDSRKRHFAHCMKALAALPDESYDLLVEDLIVAGEAGYKFDHLNSNNFLIDEEGEKINLIDMGRAPKPHKDRFGNTLYALVNAEFFLTYFSNYSDYVPEYEGEKEDTLKNIITVLDKYTRALQRNHQKYNSDSFEFHDSLLPSFPVSFWLQTWDMGEKRQKLKDMNVLYDPENPGMHGSVKIK